MRSLIACSNETTCECDRTTAGIGSTNLSNLGSIALGGVACLVRPLQEAGVVDNFVLARCGLTHIHRFRA